MSCAKLCYVGLKHTRQLVLIQLMSSVEWSESD